jgi:flagellar basal-body rod protein FlgF
MIRALYTASSGLVAESTKQDIIANNIANTQSPGFKRLRSTTVSFAEALGTQSGILSRGGDTHYPSMSSSSTRVDVVERLDDSAGPIEVTGNDFDLAIEGPGGFEVASSSGTRYTRAGNFHVGPGGELVTADGAKVQGRSGEIRVPKGKFEVKEDGAIVVDGSQVDQINISGMKDGETRVKQGRLEGANVNAVTEMVEMIANMRSFEANQKVVQSVDQTLDKLINEAGKI